MSRSLLDLVRAWELDRDYLRERAAPISATEIFRGAAKSPPIAQLEEDWRRARVAVLIGFGGALPQGAPTPDDATVEAATALALYLSDDWDLGATAETLDTPLRPWATEDEARHMLALILGGRARARLHDSGRVELLKEEP